MPSDAQFNDQVASLLMIWGVPQTPARLFGHLLQQDRPLGLDELSAALGIGRTTANDAARQMERYGFVQRHGEPGTKRVSYAPAQDFTQFFLLQASYLERMARVMGARIGEDLPPKASDRLGRIAEYYARLAAVMQEISADYP